MSPPIVYGPIPIQLHRLPVINRQPNLQRKNPPTFLYQQVKPSGTVSRVYVSNRSNSPNPTRNPISFINTSKSGNVSRQQVSPNQPKQQVRNTHVQVFVDKVHSNLKRRGF